MKRGPARKIRERIAAIDALPDTQIAWLAGIIEGEGSFYEHRSRGGTQRTPMISVNMTDKDVIDSIERILGCGQRYDVRGRTERHKHTYAIRFTGHTAIAVMRRVRPFMHGRRTDKINTLLEEFE